MKSHEEKFGSAGFMNEKPVTEIVFATGFFFNLCFLYIFVHENIFPISEKKYII